MEPRVMTEIEKRCQIADQKKEQSAFLVFDVDEVVKRVKLWREQMPRIQPYYAVKCNSYPLLIRTLTALDVCFDCASKAEIETIVNFGVPTNRIVYANTCKGSPHLRCAADLNIDLMTFDNEEELLKIKQFSPSAKLILRLNVKAVNAKMPFNEKFGCDDSDVPGLLEAALKHNFSVVGVSFHVGCENLDPIDFVIAINMCRQVFDEAEKKGISMYILDIGGGFPANTSGDLRKAHFSKIAKAINKALDKHFPSNGQYKIIAEPGRYFAATAFTLCANIIGKKKRIIDNEEDTMYFINEGIYGLFLHTVLHDVQPILAEISSDSKPKRSSIWGHSCDPLDLLVNKCMIPDLQVGDWIIFEEMGAYTVACSSTFNGFEKTEVNCLTSEETRLKLEKFFRSKLN